MKKLTSAFLAGAVLAGMLSALPVCAQTVPDPTVIDAVMLQKYLHGYVPLTESQFQFFDRNQDGAVNIYDLIALKQQLIAIRTEASVLEDYRTDEITAYKDMVWLMGMNKKPIIITSAEQFEQNMSSLFRPHVVRALTERYDQAFFQEHDLVIDFRIQGRNDYLLSVSGASMTEDTISITYEKNSIDGYTDTAILLTQIPIPKIHHTYYFDITTSGETELEYQFNSADTSVPDDAEPRLIASYAEYQEICNILPESYQNYTEDFFNEKVLYLYYTETFATERHGYSVTKSDEAITIHVLERKDNSVDFSTSFMDIITLNKSDIENAEIIMDTVVVDPEALSGQTESYVFPDYCNEPSKSLVVNYDVFQDERQLTFYLSDEPESLKELSTEECNTENPFSSYYTQEYLMGDTGGMIAGVTYKGENFSITWSELIGHDAVQVQYLNADGKTEIKKLHF